MISCHLRALAHSHWRRTTDGRPWCATRLFEEDNASTPWDEREFMYEDDCRDTPGFRDESGYRRRSCTSPGGKLNAACQKSKEIVCRIQGRRSSALGKCRGGEVQIVLVEVQIVLQSTIN